MALTLKSLWLPRLTREWLNQYKKHRIPMLHLHSQTMNLLCYCPLNHSSQRITLVGGNEVKLYNLNDTNLNSLCKYSSVDLSIVSWTRRSCIDNTWKSITVIWASRPSYRDVRHTNQQYRKVEQVSICPINNFLLPAQIGPSFSPSTYFIASLCVQCGTNFYRGHQSLKSP